MAGAQPPSDQHEQQGLDTDEGPSTSDVPYNFASTYEQVKYVPCRVENIVVQGLGRTKQSVLMPAFEDLHTARNLDELKDVLLDSWQYLNGLDIFSGVQISIVEGRPDVPGSCNIKVKVQEKGMFTMHSGAYAQGTEGSVEITAGLHNPTGHGEHLQATIEYGSQQSNEYALLLRKQSVAGRGWDGALRLLQHAKSWERQSSYTELLRGGVVELTSTDGSHQASYELGWRQVADPKRRASKSVMTQCGHSLKSALKYAYTARVMLGEADDAASAVLRSSTEVAGIGPGANLLRFAKQQLSLHWAKPLGSSQLSCGITAGLLLPWGPSHWGRPTPMCDRFFLGGPGSLWGFKLRGAGPTEPRRPSPREDMTEDGLAAPRQDALGGDIFASCIASYAFPLPLAALQNVGIHGQFFVQGGSTVLLSTAARCLRGAPGELLGSFRWTMGAGLVWPTRVGNLEVNYCQVLRRQQYDCVRNGVQVGFTPSVW